jgi:hypothetical protein
MTKNSKLLIESAYPFSKGNILAHFLDRATECTNATGKVGAIVSRTCFFLTSLGEFRSSVLGERLYTDVYVDLGSGILDAMVETAAIIFHRNPPPTNRAVFFRLLTSEQKNADMLKLIDDFERGLPSRRHQTSPGKNAGAQGGKRGGIWPLWIILREI